MIDMRPFENMDSEDPRKWQLASFFANTLGSQFLQGHQIVENRSEGEVELRGRYHNYPARMKLSLSFGSIEWELKATNPSQSHLFLHFDMDAVPNVGQFAGNASSDWDDDDGSNKFFFRRGYYMDTEDDGDRLLATYQALPEPVRTALANHMVGDRVARYYLYANGEQLLGFEDDVYALADPINHVARGVWLMGQVAWGLAQVDTQALPPPETAAPAGSLHKLTCSYCGSMYLWSQNQQCPNCGAPPQGGG